MLVNIEDKVLLLLQFGVFVFLQSIMKFISLMQFMEFVIFHIF